MTDYGMNKDGELYDEKHIPAWLVMDAIGRAIDEDVQGVESRSADTFAVLVDSDDHRLANAEPKRQPTEERDNE